MAKEKESTDKTVCAENSLKQEEQALVKIREELGEQAQAMGLL